MSGCFEPPISSLFLHAVSLYSADRYQRWRNSKWGARPRFGIVCGTGLAGSMKSFRSVPSRLCRMPWPTPSRGGWHRCPTRSKTSFDRKRSEASPPTTEIRSKASETSQLPSFLLGSASALARRHGLHAMSFYRQSNMLPGPKYWSGSRANQVAPKVASLTVIYAFTQYRKRRMPRTACYFFLSATTQITSMQCAMAIALRTARQSMRVRWLLSTSLRTKRRACVSAFAILNLLGS